ncbi:hypothetical protein [Saccharopolyspora shandongensis]|uniref:hypothetical protein n=1 Tax=Saccharopolyspora shandongensis TaxID=418495 RepID=UPI0033FC22E3
MGRHELGELPGLGVPAAGPVRLHHPGRPAGPARQAGDLVALPRPGARHADLDLLAGRSDLFTPADIEFAARQGAQAAFERDVLHDDGGLATTKDYLRAISDTRPTLTAEAITEFEQDIEAYTRL